MQEENVKSEDAVKEVWQICKKQLENNAQLKSDIMIAVPNIL